AVAYLGRQRDVLGALRAEEDGHVRPQRVDRGLQRLAQPGAVGIGQRVVLALERHRALAGEDAPHDRDVLARAGQRLAEGLPVPALDDLRARYAEPED